MNVHKIQTLVLHDERPKSWNTFWAGIHWRKRKAERDRVHYVVRVAINPNYARMFTVPIDIDIIAYFDTTGRKKQLDSPNIVSKPYIDALIGWYIEDDSRKYVRRVSTQSEVDCDFPRVYILMTPVE